jgi:hypothetical protein
MTLANHYLPFALRMAWADPKLPPHRSDQTPNLPFHAVPSVGRVEVNSVTRFPESSGPPHLHEQVLARIVGPTARPLTEPCHHRAGRESTGYALAAERMLINAGLS